MNNQMILSQIEEVTSELGEPDCKLTEPFVVSTSDNKITIQEGMMVLAPWLLNVTNQNTFMISSDKILTLIEPKPTILEKYQNLIQ